MGHEMFPMLRQKISEYENGFTARFMQACSPLVRALQGQIDRVKLMDTSIEEERQEGYDAQAEVAHLEALRGELGRHAAEMAAVGAGKMWPQKCDGERIRPASGRVADERGANLMQSDIQENDLQNLAEFHISTRSASVTTRGPGEEAISTDGVSISASGLTLSTSTGSTSTGLLAGEETAHAIIQAMTVRAFRREQPRSLDGFLKQITAAVSREVPVPFLLYWGKGDRDAAGEAEQGAFRLLDTLAERIQTVYSAGSRFTIIFTDTHALLNGYPMDGIRDYQNSLQTLVRTRKMTLVLMSRIAEIDLENLAREAQSVTMDSELFSLLVGMCRKHFRRGQDFEGGAKMYFLANQREKSFVAERYPGHIFLTYNASSLDALLPAPLPIFHMYSIKRGISAKPWFI